MFERFTPQARDAVVRSQDECRRLRHHQIGTEHILLALLFPDAGVTHTVLTAAGLDRTRVSTAIERLVGQHASPLRPEDIAALQAIGIDADEVLRRAGDLLGGTPAEEQPRRGLFRRRRPPSSGHVRFSPRAKKVIELSLREALALKHNYIGAEHILLGLLREGNGLGAAVLADAGVDVDGLRRATITALDQAA